MLNTLPPSTRVIAPNLRGYKGSSDWTGFDHLNGGELLDRLAHDYVDIITWVTQELADSQHGEPQICLGAWSLGNLGMIWSYYLLSSGQLNDAQQKVLETQVKRIIFYEPPSYPVFSTPQDATTKHSFANIDKFHGAEQGQKLMEYLTGVFHFDSTVVQDWQGADSRYQTEVFEFSKSLCLEPSFKSAHLDDVLNFGPVGTYVSMRASPEGRDAWNAKAIAAVQALVNAPGVEIVQGLYGTTSLPECILGPIWVIQQAQLVEDSKQKTSPSKSKARTDSVDEPCGHYMHAVVPEEFWKKITAE